MYDLAYVSVILLHKYCRRLFSFIVLGYNCSISYSNVTENELLVIVVSDYRKLQAIPHIERSYTPQENSSVGRSIIGGDIFIYSCLHNLETIDF